MMESKLKMPVDNLASNNQLLGATKSEISSKKLTVENAPVVEKRSEITNVENSGALPMSIPFPYQKLNNVDGGHYQHHCQEQRKEARSDRGRTRRGEETGVWCREPKVGHVGLMPKPDLKGCQIMPAH